MIREECYWCKKLGICWSVIDSKIICYICYIKRINNKALSLTTMKPKKNMFKHIKDFFFPKPKPIDPILEKLLSLYPTMTDCLIAHEKQLRMMQEQLDELNKAHEAHKRFRENPDNPFF